MTNIGFVLFIFLFFGELEKKSLTQLVCYIVFYIKKKTFPKWSGQIFDFLISKNILLLFFIPLKFIDKI